MPSPANVFLAAAAVVLLGYAAGRLAQATRFPDVPALLLVGLLLGPANRWLVERGHGWTALAEALDTESLRLVAPYVSGLALVVILFEAGLGMELRQVRRSLGPAARLALPVFLLTAAAIALIGVYVFGMPRLVAAVLGVALSNVGQTVSSALLRRMDLDERTRSIGLVEMALYDVVSVPILVSLFHVAGGTAEGSELWGDALSGFAQTASISLSVGGLGGFLWILALGRLRGHPHSYMLTMAALLVVYALTEQLEGAGAVSVLLFGLLIGNRTDLLRLLRRGTESGGEEGKVQTFHEEVSFVTRTVFFLFLGLSFTIGLRDAWPVDSPLPWLSVLDHRASLFGLGALLVLASLPVARAVGIPLVAGRNREWHGLIPVFGHGLGTAVLATLPFTWQAFEPGTAFHDRFAPWQPVFLNLALVVILGSVLLSGALVFVAQRWGAARPPARDAAPTDHPGPSGGAAGPPPATPAEPPIPAFSATPGDPERPEPPAAQPAARRPPPGGASKPAPGKRAPARKASPSKAQPLSRRDRLRR